MNVNTSEDYSILDIIYFEPIFYVEWHRLKRV
jgi:hypothetical protein